MEATAAAAGLSSHSGAHCSSCRAAFAVEVSLAAVVVVEESLAAVVVVVILPPGLGAVAAVAAALKLAGHWVAAWELAAASSHGSAVACSGLAVACRWCG